MIKFMCILLCLNLSFFLSQQFDDDDNIASIASNPPLFPPPENHDKGPFKPSIHMIVGAVIFTFSITFLVFLYVKHCKSGSNGYPSNSRGNIDSYTARKNSGIDPNVIDLLPVFRFSALRGQKDGLECAVCLTNYEPSEVLRLLPKCKHAFHVECVDTWLDAHSTCPLCRYRVDPEDVLLIEHHKTLLPPQQIQQQTPQVQDQELVQAIHRTPGRHSSAGEKITKTSNGYLQITVQKPPNASMSTRHSLDSSITTKCFEKPRKDELLLAGKEPRSDLRRLQHRIVVSSNEQQRWSDVRPSELLYIGSEKLMSESRRVSTASEKRRSVGVEGEGIEWSGRKVINERSVSEIISRKRSNEIQQQRQRQHEGFVSRWLAWASFDSHNNNNNNNNNINNINNNNNNSSHLQPPPVLHTFHL